MVYLIIWAMSFSVTGAAVTDQFKFWYPQFGVSFETTKTEICSVEYARYVTGDTANNDINLQAGADRFSVLTQPLLDCMLKDTSEFIKGNMTGAQVLLGVMPTVLSLLSASVEELALVITVSRRPVLGLLLAFASPSAYFSRAFSYPDVSQILSKDKHRLPQSRPSSRIWQAGISALEYVTVFAVAANVLHCSWEVGIRAVSFILTSGAFLPPLWVGSGVIVQLLGAVVFRLRVQGWRDTPTICHQRSIEKENRTYHDWAALLKWLRNIFRRLRGLSRTEVVPSASSELEVRIATYPERKTFVIASSLQSTMAVLHVVFGTLTFSSMVFIGTQDALSIVSRFFISTVVCRIVVRYELAGLREACVSIQSATEPIPAQECCRLRSEYTRQVKVGEREVDDSSRSCFEV